MVLFSTAIETKSSFKHVTITLHFIIKLATWKEVNSFAFLAKQGNIVTSLYPGCGRSCSIRPNKVTVYSIFTQIIIYRCALKCSGIDRSVALITVCQPVFATRIYFNKNDTYTFKSTLGVTLVWRQAFKCNLNKSHTASSTKKGLQQNYTSIPYVVFK